MNIDQVKEIARGKGIKPGRMKKVEIIRAIQAAEGNPTCFQTGTANVCGQAQCLWRPDCS